MGALHHSLQCSLTLRTSTNVLLTPSRLWGDSGICEQLLITFSSLQGLGFVRGCVGRVLGTLTERYASAHSTETRWREPHSPSNMAKDRGVFSGQFSHCWGPCNSPEPQDRRLPRPPQCSSIKDLMVSIGWYLGSCLGCRSVLPRGGSRASHELPPLQPGSLHNVPGIGTPHYHLGGRGPARM